MCGIAGFIDFERRLGDPHALLNAMGVVLRHRGPDDEGSWFDPETGVGLAHRRLSILDTSREGRQPMVSASGRYVIIFNGEVYNFTRLRRELEPLGDVFRGRSDTEVMLAVIERFGVHAALERFTGMFALALWDREHRVLYLARDRLGKKPLYYGLQRGLLVFGSEVKALEQVAQVSLTVDRDALALYIRYGYVPTPHSIYAGINKLEPGHVLRVDMKGVLSKSSYWDLCDVYRRRNNSAASMDFRDADARLQEILSDAVALRMISDVPLGAFLSGGIDSSLIVALMQQQSSRPVRTFTVGFREDKFDEAQQARAVAQHLGTEHTDLYVGPADALAVIPRLPLIYDEPFGDSSQVPTYLIAGLARNHVTVALSGDGGDEVFCGYNRYALGRATWSRLMRLPRSVRRVIARAIPLLSVHTWNRIAGPLQGILPHHTRVLRPGEKLHKLVRTLSSESIQDYYAKVVTHWADPETVLTKATAQIADPLLMRLECQPQNPVDEMMLRDMYSYLPDDILVKVDRASMAVSLEARAPLLDHRVVEFALGLPTNLKLESDVGKQILRKVLYRFVPRNLVERPKAGFALPLGEWLRGPLRDWAESLIAPNVLRNGSFLRPESIQTLWQEHLAGRGDAAQQLWIILMFQGWLEARRSSRRLSAT